MFDMFPQNDEEEPRWGRTAKKQSVFTWFSTPDSEEIVFINKNFKCIENVILSYFKISICMKYKFDKEHGKAAQNLIKCFYIMIFCITLGSQKFKKYINS